jgi:hypothetical protein
MIQRKQTLFLLQSLFFNIALFFIPNKYFITDLLNKQALYLIPVVNSSIGHYVAITINCLMIILTLIVIFQRYILYLVESTKATASVFCVKISVYFQFIYYFGEITYETHFFILSH